MRQSLRAPEFQAELRATEAVPAVDGKRWAMRPLDLVLTPNWQWHDHGNASGQPMICLDGLDIPTVRFHEASFAERLDQPS